MTSIKQTAVAASGGTITQGATSKPDVPRALRFATILVPIDYSEASQAAFEYALDLAEKFGSRVCLLHVLENRAAPVGPSSPPASKGGTVIKEGRKLVEFAKAGSHPFVPVFPEVRCGEPWEEIVSAARKEKADLILIPTHGRTGLKQMLIGSVTEKVVRQAHCPVLVIRDAQVDLLVTGKQKKEEP